MQVAHPFSMVIVKKAKSILSLPIRVFLQKRNFLRQKSRAATTQMPPLSSPAIKNEDRP